jgi:lipoyl synthase
MMRISFGTAVALGLKTAKVDVLPTTAYLMLGENCSKRCAFCPQGAHQNKVEPSTFLSRISWAPYEPEIVLTALLGAYKEEKIKRVCLQLVSGKDAVTQALNFAAQMLEKTPIPISISTSPLNPEALLQAQSLGIDTLCFPLDIARADLYTKYKGGDWKAALNYLKSAKEHFKGKISTHIILGLEESEKDIIKLLQLLHKHNIFTGLFAFTPMAGTLLAQHHPPELKTYRKMQIARYLIVNNIPYNFKFKGDCWKEENWQELANLIKAEIFCTSGCDSCNRPYYNEKPQGPWYNYPRMPTEKEREQAIADAFN